MSSSTELSKVASAGTPSGATELHGRLILHERRPSAYWAICQRWMLGTFEKASAVGPKRLESGPAPPDLPAMERIKDLFATYR